MELSVERKTQHTMISFTITRSGKNTFRTEGPTHCGTADFITVNWKVQVVCGEGSLDSRGFLFDQMRVVAYFDRLAKSPIKDSCEMFAYKAAKGIFAVVKAENKLCQIDALSVSISPMEGAEMTFVYEDEGEPKKKGGR